MKCSLLGCSVVFDDLANFPQHVDLRITNGGTQARKLFCTYRHYLIDAGALIGGEEAAEITEVANRRAIVTPALIDACQLALDYLRDRRHWNQTEVGLALVLEDALATVRQERAA